MQKLVSSTIQRTYNSKFGDVVVQLGLRSLFKNLYAAALYHTSDGTDTVSIGEYSASYRIDSPRTAFEVYQNIPNESPIIKSFLDEATPGDIFYDIGAGIGSYTCFLGQSVGRTVAFEPDQTRYELLQENIEMNHIDGETQNVALGEVTGEQETNEHVDTTVINGDEHRTNEDLPVPDMLKIDVDGPELHVLRGLKQTLAHGPRLIWMEIHPNRLAARGQSIDDIVVFLSDLGFSVRKRSIHGLKSPYIEAVK